MYGKLFTQMYTGTLASKGPWEALVTFQQLIILSDPHGVVDMTAEAISRQTTIPLEIIRTGLAALEKVDIASRTPNEEGRRITRLSDSRDWGWQITNYVMYRNIRSQEDRRAYMREYQCKRRAVNKPVNNVSNVNQSSKQYEEVEEKEKIKTKVAPLALPAWLDPEIWNSYVKSRKSKTRSAESLKAALAKLERFRAEGHDANEIVSTSLANGWQGLFAPDAKGGKAKIIPQPPRIQCGNCSKPLAGSWTESPKGKVCDQCHRAYMNGAWPT